MTAPFVVGDQVRDKSGIKDLNGKPVQGRVVRVSPDGQLALEARDGHKYLYGGDFVLRPLSNLERIRGILRIG